LPLYHAIDTKPLQDKLYGLVHHHDPSFQNRLSGNNSFVKIYQIKPDAEEPSEKFSLVAEFGLKGCDTPKLVTMYGALPDVLDLPESLCSGKQIFDLIINRGRIVPPMHSTPTARGYSVFKQYRGRHKDYYITEFTRYLAGVISMDQKMVKDISGVTRPGTEKFISEIFSLVKTARGASLHVVLDSTKLFREEIEKCLNAD
jgi:hypothetical protein